MSSVTTSDNITSRVTPLQPSPQALLTQEHFASTDAACVNPTLDEGFFPPTLGKCGTVLVYGFPSGDAALLRSIFGRYGHIQRVYKGRRISVFGVVFLALSEAEHACKSLNRVTFSHGPNSMEPPSVLELVLYGPDVSLSMLFPPVEFSLEYQALVPSPRIILPGSTISAQLKSQQMHGTPSVGTQHSATSPLTSLGSVCDSPRKVVMGPIPDVNVEGGNMLPHTLSDSNGVSDSGLSNSEISLIDKMQNLVISDGNASNNDIGAAIPQPLTRGFTVADYSSLASYPINPAFGGINGCCTSPVIPNVYVEPQLKQQQMHQQHQPFLISPIVTTQVSPRSSSSSSTSPSSSISPLSPAIQSPKYSMKKSWEPKWQQQQKQKKQPIQLVPSPQSQTVPLTQVRQKRIYPKGSAVTNAHSQQQCTSSSRGSSCGKFGQPHVVSSKPKRRYDPNFSVNIINGSVLDPRTTLMIRNIPNRYTQQMILESLDICLLGKYNFFYLPIDFQNQCNVGYAFINMTNIVYIPLLYDMFHNKGWKLFKSEKICEVTYARIQGLQGLVDHFKSSSLLSEDEDVRPIVMVNGRLVPFPVNANITVRRIGDREIISL